MVISLTDTGSSPCLVSHGCLGWGVADTLREMFPECHLTHRHRIESLLGESWMSGVGGG